MHLSCSQRRCAIKTRVTSGNQESDGSREPARSSARDGPAPKDTVRASGRVAARCSNYNSALFTSIDVSLLKSDFCGKGYQRSVNGSICSTNTALPAEYSSVRQINLANLLHLTSEQWFHVVTLQRTCSLNTCAASLVGHLC